MRRNAVSRGFWRKISPEQFQWDNAVLRELPIDKEVKNYVRDPVVGACFSKVMPTPIEEPELVIYSKEALRLIGIDAWSKTDDATEPNRPDQNKLQIESLVPYLAGNELFDGSETAAQCYCGHQFGYFSGQLGDGAAIYLGEVVKGKLEPERWEVQLKGAGMTPYSRKADGRKVLRSTLREFLASEHLHALGIPTTRAGSVVVSHKTKVLRDIFYDGNANEEPCAVVMRVAKSFLRFGSFEIFKDTDPTTGRRGPSANLQNKEQMLTKMVNFCIHQYFPEIYKNSPDTNARYQQLYAEIVRRTAQLVAKWQCMGFCHGVLNTDNMSIIGDTLDYGPFGFMEHFNPAHICNTSDDSGRYRYQNQPSICRWNCEVLADQFSLIMSRTMLIEELAKFDTIYQTEYDSLMREKLGLLQKVFPDDDKQLINDLYTTLAVTGGDFTCCFRCLSELNAFDPSSAEIVVQKLVEFSENLDQLKRKFISISDDQFKMIEMILHKNPAQARMYGITPEAFDQLKEERKQLELLKTKTDSDRKSEVTKAWTDWVSLYIERLEKETDSIPDAAVALVRRHKMNSVNPIYVLRNHVAQKAIDFAEQGEYGMVEHIFALLTNPFEEGTPCDLIYARPDDPLAPPLRVSCSS
jgi:uncharacterized protein YdiU (UPF0061 family)